MTVIPLSETWKVRFELIEKAGGDRLPYIERLTAKERIQVRFNGLAFLFGPFYYVAKGMWRRAITILAVAFVFSAPLTLIFRVLGLEDMERAITLAVSAVFAFKANLDYYFFAKLGKKLWW